MATAFQMIKILPLELLGKKKKKTVADPLLHPFSEIYFLACFCIVWKSSAEIIAKMDIEDLIPK